MSDSLLGPVPPEIKGCQHFMKLADDHDKRNIVVAYYARMAAVQMAMKIFPGTKPPEISKYLMDVMDWLEKTKKENTEVEGIGNETVAQAVIEEYMLKLYNFAYKSDVGKRFNKNMVKAYYTASLLCEVLVQFGPLSEDIETKCSTAKHRAAYLHNMLKNGQEPTAINVTVLSSDEDESEHILTLEELNKRRALRGEDPLPEGKPPIDPAVRAAAKKAMDEVRARGNEELEEELRKIKERIDADEIHNPANFDPCPPPLILGPIPTERIIEMGPQIYPEPRLPYTSHSRPEDEDGQAATNGRTLHALEPAQTEKAMKYCKWASSALNYDDIKTAIENLERALHLCKYGKEKD